MPTKQRGSVSRHGTAWRARWRDENGVQHTKGGFPTKTAAADWLDDKIKDVAALRNGETVPSEHRPQTCDDLFDLFLEKHGATVDRATYRKLTQQLYKARNEFGSRRPESLNRLEIEDWRASLPDGSRPDVFRAARQAFTWAHARGLIAREPTAGIRNPKRRRHERREITPFETWQEIEAVNDELRDNYRGIPEFVVATGLRPEEWIALERDDVDRANRLLRVCKRFTDWQLKRGTKTVPERFVPLRQRALDALDSRVPRIDTPLLFPAPRGGYINLERFRDNEWRPALRAAGLATRGPYTMRHTFATWAIADDTTHVSLSHLAKIMGTSVKEIEDTYARWLRRTDDTLRAAFDAYDARQAAEA